MKITEGFKDFQSSLKRWKLWTLLGWLEIRHRYDRSKLGPFWLTISMGVMIGTISVVYGTLFGQNLSSYLPMLAIGIVIWTLFSTIIIESSNIFISCAPYIKQIRTPRLIFIFQVIWKNIIIFLHNSVIIFVILIVTGVANFSSVLYAILGIFLLIINAGWIALFVAIISARFRDFSQIIQSGMQVLFYVTPIIFEPKMLGKYFWIAQYNPIAHFLSLIRDPLMGIHTESISWTLAILMAFFGWLLAIYFLSKYHQKIPYWI